MNRISLLMAFGAGGFIGTLVGLFVAALLVSGGRDE